jgi:hypothetical protein
LKSQPATLTAGLFALRRRTLVIAALFALFLLAGGWIVRPDTRPGVIMLGVATSVLAAVGLALTTVEREEFAQRILDLGVQRIFDNRVKDLDEQLWTDLLGNTEREFRVLGMANHGYLNSAEARRETETALHKALGRPKPEVEFLWLNPEHQLSRLREAEEGERGLRRDTCASIVFFWELREKLDEDQKCRFSMREYKAVPTCGLSWSDDYMVVTHYLAGQLNLRAPGVVLRSSIPRYERLFARFRQGEPVRPGLAKKYTDNYQEIAGDQWSRPIDAVRVTHLRGLLDELAANQPEKQSEAELRQVEQS